MNEVQPEETNYVRALCSYNYVHKGKEICMVKDEVFLLVKKTTDDWWQVIRNGDKKTFYAPSKYLEESAHQHHSRKSSLKKKIAHQRHLQNQQRLHLESLTKTRRNRDPICEDPFVVDSLNQPADVDGDRTFLDEEIEHIRGQPCGESVSQIAALPSNSSESMNMPIDVKDNSISNNGNEVHCHIEIIDPPGPFLDQNKNENSPERNISRSGSSNVVSPFSDDSMKEESLDSIWNKSADSFNDSVESVNESSHLESFSTNTSKSSLNISQGSVDSFNHLKGTFSKAASVDVIQTNVISDEVLVPTCTKAVSSEELDRQNHTKDTFLFPNNPLSLRNRSNSVDLKRVENKFDLTDFDKGNFLDRTRKFRITRDPMNRRRSWALNDSCALLGHKQKYFDKNSFQKVSEMEQCSSFDLPPKLPPKLKKGSSILSASTDNLQNISTFNQNYGYSAKSNCSQITPPSTYPRKIIPQHLEGKDGRNHIPSSKVRSTIGEPNQDNINKKPNKPPRDISSHSNVTTAENLPDDTEIETHKEKSENNGDLPARNLDLDVAKENSVEQLIEKMEIKSKQAEHNVKLKAPYQAPPMPSGAPQRILFDGWGEFMDSASGRPFYYNKSTQERRWKPPRKTVHSSTLQSASNSELNKECASSTFKDTKAPMGDNMMVQSLSHQLERSFVSPSYPGGVTSQNTVHLPLLESTSVMPYGGVSSHSNSAHVPLNQCTSVNSSLTSSCTLPTSHPKIFGSSSSDSSKGSNTLPSFTVKETKATSPPPTTKSSKSFFSSLSSSFSFVKHSSSSHNIHQAHSITPPLTSHHYGLPEVPPSTAKPPRTASPTDVNFFSLEAEQRTLHYALQRFYVPPGWQRKYDALSHQVYFESRVTGEKWNPAIDKSGTVYVYSATGTESKWNLPEYEDVSPPSPLSSSPASPIEKYESVKEDMLVWRFSMKEGKKVKKSWATSYARYFPLRKKTAFGKPFGVIVFSKKQSDTKKSESFDLVPPCFIDCHMKKQNSLCLRNGDSTEVQLQAETPAVATEWTKLLFEHDNVQEKNLSSEKEKKISLKSSDKVLSKKDSAPGSPTSPGNPSDEADAVKGIKDTLITFFKRRMQQETLAKKGIYKDTVFGSTIAEICLKEQLNTPLFVLQVIRNIERDRENFLIDGLYRISGNASRIQKIRIEVGQNRYGILEEEKDVHNLTGSLKLFFRELKEPLIPFTHYQAFIQATDHLKSKSRPEAIRQAVKKLPHNNRETLKIVLDHLLKVNEFESDNRMSIMNLAIVFGPCLLWPAETTGLDLMTDAMLHNRVVEALLSDFQFVFKKR